MLVRVSANYVKCDPGVKYPDDPSNQIDFSLSLSILLDSLLQGVYRCLLQCLQRPSNKRLIHFIKRCLLIPSKNLLNLESTLLFLLAKDSH